MFEVRRANPLGRVRTDKSRLGEQNGRTKLPDQSVVLIRMFRDMWENKPSYHELADLFGIHPRHAKRICMGEVRVEAGGPIEPEQADEAIRYEDPPFDTAVLKRCSECGHMCHPVQVEPALCLHCRTEAEILEAKRNRRVLQAA